MVHIPISVVRRLRNTDSGSVANRTADVAGRMRQVIMSIRATVGTQDTRCQLCNLRSGVGWRCLVSHVASTTILLSSTVTPDWSIALGSVETVGSWIHHPDVHCRKDCVFRA